MRSYYDPHSTLAPDGVCVVCPVENMERHTESIGGGGYRQLAHPQIIPRTMQFSTEEEAWTDLQLHGHSIYIVGNNDPYVNHAEGSVKLVWPNAETIVSYSYAARPGRWINEFTPCEPITPSMLGATGNGDESNILAWTLTLAGRYGVDVLIDREYGFSRILEIPHGVTLRGLGMHKPGLRLLTADLLQRMRIDCGNYDSRWGWETEFDAMVSNGPPAITHKPYATEVVIENLRIDGTASTPELRAIWDEVQNDPSKWNAEDTSNTFRNSPAGVGLSFGNQNGRPCENLHVTLRNVAVVDMPGSCIAMNIAVDVDAENIVAGPSVAAMCWYNLSHRVRNVKFVGGGRRTITRVTSDLDCDGLRFHGNGWQNPWPDNTSESAVLGIGNPLGHGPVNIRNIDINCRDSAFPTAIAFGSNTRLQGRVEAGIVFAQAQATISRDTIIDLVTVDVPPIPLTFYGYDARLERAFIRHDNTCTNATPPIAAAPTITVKRSAAHQPGDVQVIEIVGKSTWPVLRPLEITDYGQTVPSERVPTRITCRDCTFHNQRHTLVGLMPGGDTLPPSSAEIGSPEVTVLFDNCLMNFHVGPGYGDPYDDQFKLIRLHNCRTHDGMVSEQNGVAMIGSGQPHVDVQTDLMWKPRAFSGGEWMQRPDTMAGDWTRPIVRFTTDCEWWAKVTP